jgi:hypothetical protein
MLLEKFFKKNKLTPFFAASAAEHSQDWRTSFLKYIKDLKDDPVIILDQ